MIPLIKQSPNKQSLHRFQIEQRTKLGIMKKRKKLSQVLEDNIANLNTVTSSQELRSKIEIYEALISCI